jgi:glycosyltransferase involved in cell wall biosynthesis
MIKNLTILIPTFNSAKFLKECLNSALPLVEEGTSVVVYDSYSTDETLSILEAHPIKERLTVLSGEPKGCYNAWNQLIEAVESDYAIILTSDDVLVPENVIEVLRVLQHTSVPYVLGDCSVIDEGNQILMTSKKNKFSSIEPCDLGGDRSPELIPVEPKAEFLLESVGLGYYHSITSFIFETRWLKQHPFNENSGSEADLEWWLEVLAEGQVSFVASVLSQWRRREGQVSRSKPSMGYFDRRLALIRSAGRNFFEGARLNQFEELGEKYASYKRYISWKMALKKGKLIWFNPLNVFIYVIQDIFAYILGKTPAFRYATKLLNSYGDLRKSCQVKQKP